MLSTSGFLTADSTYAKTRDLLGLGDRRLAAGERHRTGLQYLSDNPVTSPNLASCKPAGHNPLSLMLDVAVLQRHDPG